jgi:glycosyltransferase involved in cell wall biosynthesis
VAETTDDWELLLVDDGSRDALVRCREVAAVARALGRDWQTGSV